MPFCGCCQRFQNKSGLPEPVCTWPSSISRVKDCPKATSSPSDDSGSQGNFSSTSCDDVGDSPRIISSCGLSPTYRSETTEQLRFSPNKTSLESEISHLPKSLMSLNSAKFSSSAELRILDFLIERFESFAYPVYADQSMSLSNQWLLLATIHNPLARAFLACGSALISKINPREEEKRLSISLHSTALRAISLNLRDSPEEIVAMAALLLHICEVRSQQ